MHLDNYYSYVVLSLAVGEDFDVNVSALTLRVPETKQKKTTQFCQLSRSR